MLGKFIYLLIVITEHASIKHVIIVLSAVKSDQPSHNRNCYLRERARAVASSAHSYFLATHLIIQAIINIATMMSPNITNPTLPTTKTLIIVNMINANPSNNKIANVIISDSSLEIFCHNRNCKIGEKKESPC